MFHDVLSAAAYYVSKSKILSCDNEHIL